MNCALVQCPCNILDNALTQLQILKMVKCVINLLDGETFETQLAVSNACVTAITCSNVQQSAARHVNCGCVNALKVKHCITGKFVIVLSFDQSALTAKISSRQQQLCCCFFAVDKLFDKTSRFATLVQLHSRV